MQSHSYAAKAALAIAILMIVSSPARADHYAYAVSTEGLYLVDLTTWQATEIGALGFFVEGLATSPDGKLFGTDVSGNLYFVNAKTAQTTLIGSTGQGDIEGMDYEQGKVLGVTFTSANPTVFLINTSNAQTRNLFTAGSSTGAIRSMCVRDNAHVLVVGDGPPANTLYSIALHTGEVVAIGTLDIGTALLPAMDFVDGVLYGLDSLGNEWTIDPDTADVTFVGNTGGQFWLDMKAIPPQ